MAVSTLTYPIFFGIMSAIAVYYAKKGIDKINNKTKGRIAEAVDYFDKVTTKQ